MIVRVYQLHLSRLNLGQVQNIVDKRQQIPGRRLDIAGVTVHLTPLALLHNNIAQSHNRIHGRAYLMGHIRQELAFRLIRLLRLHRNPFNLFNIILDFRHVQNHNHMPLDHAKTVRHRLHMALIITVPDKNIMFHFFARLGFREIQYLCNISAEGTAVQPRKNLSRRRIIIDNAPLVIQRDHTVAHTVQKRARGKTSEVVNPPAPYENHHTGEHHPQNHRRKIIGARQLRDIGAQGNDRQERESQNQPAFAIHRIFSLSGTGTD